MCVYRWQYYEIENRTLMQQRGKILRTTLNRGFRLLSVVVVFFFFPPPIRFFVCFVIHFCLTFALKTESLFALSLSNVMWAVNLWSRNWCFIRDEEFFYTPLAFSSMSIPCIYQSDLEFNIGKPFPRNIEEGWLERWFFGRLQLKNFFYNLVEWT